MSSEWLTRTSARFPNSKAKSPSAESSPFLQPLFLAPGGAGWCSVSGGGGVGVSTLHVGFRPAKHAGSSSQGPSPRFSPFHPETHSLGPQGAPTPFPACALERGSSREGGMGRSPHPVGFLCSFLPFLRFLCFLHFAKRQTV